MLDRLLTSTGTDPELLRKGRLLNGMLLTVVALLLFFITFDSLFNRTLRVHILTLVMLVATLVLYGLTRWGYVRLSAISLLGTIMAVLTVGTLVPEAGNLSTLITPCLFALPIILTGVLISWRWVLPVTLLACLDTVWLYNVGAPSFQDYRVQHPDDMVIFSLIAVILLFGVGTLGTISSRQIEQALATLRRQNHDLLSANHDLAQQRQQADTLGISIGALAAQLSQVSARQVRGVSAQARSISHVVSAVTELHTTADQIAAMGQQVRLAADATMRNVQSGQVSLLHSREAVQRTQVQVQQVIERMTVLETVTARITAFVDSIRELSEETHRLALNATIEAAGAGALGRRFGVVATEVRSLSNRANDVVDQIHLLITELEQAGRVTLVATQASIKGVQEVEESSLVMREMQDQVVQAAQHTTELVQFISTAASQQTTATEQMAQTMQEIAAVSAETSQDADALDRVIHELHRTALQLNKSIALLHAGG